MSCDERGQLLYRLRLFAGALGAALGQPSAKADLGCICCFIRIPSRYSCHRREFSANRDEREAARCAADLTPSPPANDGGSSAAHLLRLVVARGRSEGPGRVPQRRARLLLEGFEGWAIRRGGPRPEPRGAAYTFLHSLSHTLMSEIAIDCGYPASSLKERVYALPPATQGGPLRCGILIYIATAGTQGTLGGLVEVVSRFAGVLRSSLRRLELCSSDPVCADHDPTGSTDDRALHGAACHGCLLIAETSWRSPQPVSGSDPAGARFGGSRCGVFQG